MSVINTQEDKEFLNDQRTDRKLFIGGTDMNFETKRKAKMKRQREAEIRRQKSQANMEKEMQTVSFDLSDSSNEDATDLDFKRCIKRRPT